MADLQCIARQLLNALADAPAVERGERERLEDEEVECALENVRGVGHAGSCRMI